MVLIFCLFWEPKYQQQNFKMNNKLKEKWFSIPVFNILHSNPFMLNYFIFCLIAQNHKAPL